MLRLKELRMEQGWTQLELAKSLQVARNTISQWESGVREPDYGMLSFLADMFNVSIDYLLGRSMLRSDEHEMTAYADAYGSMFDALEGSPEERLQKKLEIDDANMREGAEDQLKRGATSKVFGDYLREKRGEMPLREAAMLCGISHTYLDSLEKGYDPTTGKPVNITIETLKRIEKGLNLQSGELVMLAAGHNITTQNDEFPPEIKGIARGLQDLDPQNLQLFKNLLETMQKAGKDAKNGDDS